MFAGVKWRKLLRALHRDLGYVAVALTLAYGLSGIAVNHIQDWNPSYHYSESAVAIGPITDATLDAQAATIVSRLRLDPQEVRGHFAETDHELRVFLAQGQEVRVEVATGVGVRKGLANRPVFFQVNALHLNNLKGVWTYVADLFAIALMVLAVTGMTMMKGDRGFLGRGKYFVAAGLAIPILAVIYLYKT